MKFTLLTIRGKGAIMSLITKNAMTERSNTEFRFQRVRDGESRISESVRITLPSGEPKGSRYYVLRLSRQDVFRTLQRTKSDRFCGNSGGTTGFMQVRSRPVYGRGLFGFS